jgi:TetR/AcrR family transcriptional repressor of multidrug resistance operon
MRQRDENKAAAIREHAIRMIVEQGFDGLSMQKLAKQAGISPSTIYIYFESRKDLLTKLYMETESRFEDDALSNFSPDIPFEEGLRIQWKNRLKNIVAHPLEYRFHEQFRNSPLINHNEIQPRTFRKAMQQFVRNAEKRGEIRALPPEIFWAIAYGPFYTLVKFHLDRASMSGKPFSLTESKLKQAFGLVISALKP